MTPSILSNHEMSRASIVDEPRLYDGVQERMREMKLHRMPIQATWEEIWEYVIPERELFLKWFASGAHLRPNSEDEFAAKIGQYIHDSTASNGLHLLTAGLQGYVVSEQDRWFKVSYPSRQMENLPGARQWAQNVEFVLYDRLAKSNFYAELSPLILDSASIGTATQYRSYDEETGTPIFNTVHPLESYIDVNDRMRVDTVYRMINLTKRQAIQKFGQDRLSDEIMNSNSSTQQFKFIHAVFPRGDTDRSMGLRDREMGSVLNIDAPYISVYVEAADEQYRSGSESVLHQSQAGGTSAETKKVVHVGGYQQMPYSVWRWDVDPATPYGMSPTRRMMPQIRKLNFFGELLAEDATLQVRPPVMVPSILQGKVNMSPRGFNYTSDVNAKIEAIVAATGNYPVGRDQTEDLRQQVREALGVDYFILIARLTAQGQSKTAYEIGELQSEKAAVLASIKRNMGPELLVSTLRWIFIHEMRRGSIPPPPEALQPYMRTPGGSFHVEFIGPLAQAQKRLSSVQGRLRVLDSLYPILDRQPQGWDVLRIDNIILNICREGGMQYDDVRELDEIKKLRDLAAQQAQERQQMEQLEAASRAHRNFNSGAPGQGAGADAIAAAGATQPVAS